MNCQNCGFRNFSRDRLCAKCGRPLPAGTSSKTVITVVAVVGGLALLGVIFRSVNDLPRNSSSTNQKQDQEEVVHIDKSSEKQAQRLKAIQGLTKRGAFAKIEPDTTSKPGSGIMPSVYVRTAFYTLTIDEKEFIARLLYEYYCEGGYYDSVLFFDNYSGKKVASYHPHLGFRME
jgi:hypothetical protein